MFDFKNALLVATLLLQPLSGNCQSFLDGLPPGYDRVTPKEEKIHSVPEGAQDRLFLERDEGLAIWFELMGGVEVFTTASGATRFEGYWQEAKGNGSRVFAKPMGPQVQYSAGEEALAGKNYVYWAPDLGDAYVDYSDALVLSHDGRQVGYHTYEDNEKFVYNTGQRFGPFTRVFHKQFDDRGRLLFLAVSPDGSVNLHRDAEILFADINRKEFKSLVTQQSDDREHYLYGFIEDSRYWLLHDGKVITSDTETIPNVIHISDDGTKLFEARIEGNTVDMLFDGKPTGRPFNDMSQPTYDGATDRYILPVMRLETAGDGSEPVEHWYVLTEDREFGPFSGIQEGHHHRAADGAVVFGYKEGDRDFVRVGEETLGPFDDLGRIVSAGNAPRTAFEARLGSEWHIVTETDRYPLPEGTESTLLEITRDGKVVYFAKVGGAQVFFENGREIATGSRFWDFRVSRESDDYAFVLSTDGKQTLHRNGVPSIWAPIAYARGYLREGAAAPEHFAIFIDDDNAVWGVIGSSVAGPYDRIFSHAHKTRQRGPDAFLFHAMRGSDILKVSWPD